MDRRGFPPEAGGAPGALAWAQFGTCACGVAGAEAFECDPGFCCWPSLTVPSRSESERQTCNCVSFSCLSTSICCCSCPVCARGCMFFQNIYIYVISFRDVIKDTFRELPVQTVHARSWRPPNGKQIPAHMVGCKTNFEIRARGCCDNNVQIEVALVAIDHSTLALWCDSAFASFSVALHSHHQRMYVRQSFYSLNACVMHSFPHVLFVVPVVPQLVIITIEDEILWRTIDQEWYQKTLLMQLVVSAPGPVYVRRPS